MSFVNRRDSIVSITVPRESRRRLSYCPASLHETSVSRGHRSRRATEKFAWVVSIASRTVVVRRHRCIRWPTAREPHETVRRIRASRFVHNLDVGVIAGFAMLFLGKIVRFGEQVSLV
jgi:hypothetical protein